MLKVFSSYDTNGDGTIGMVEFEQGLLKVCMQGRELARAGIVGGLTKAQVSPGAYFTKINNTENMQDSVLFRALYER